MQEYERAVIFRIGRLVPGGAKGPGESKSKKNTQQIRKQTNKQQQQQKNHVVEKRLVHELTVAEVSSHTEKWFMFNHTTLFSTKEKVSKRHCEDFTETIFSMQRV